MLTQNLLAWLLPDADASVEGVSCGESVSFTLDARTVSARVETPSGLVVTLENAAFSETDELGIYRLRETLEDGGERVTAFALHIPQAECDTLTVPASVQGEAAQNEAGYREWTLWIVLALFALMLVEWGVSRRGT